MTILEEKLVNLQEIYFFLIFKPVILMKGESCLVCQILTFE